MKLTIHVTVEGVVESYFACKEVSEYQMRCFKPLHTTDDPILSLVTGAEHIGSEKTKVILKTRKDVAKDLAIHLSSMIEDAMKNNDTKNGYGV